ncbi:unnamed protein product, partial [Choristocarpus tenellus]
METRRGAIRGEGVANLDDGTQRKALSRRTGKRQGKAGAKGISELSTLLNEDIERESRDPYRINDPVRYPRCNPQDHLKKKNCIDNPRCLYGLGEWKEGIWAKRPGLVRALGEDPSVVLRKNTASQRTSKGTGGGEGGGTGGAAKVAGESGERSSTG